MVPDFLHFLAMLGLAMLAVRLAEAYLPEGAFSNGVHFLFK